MVGDPLIVQRLSRRAAVVLAVLFTVSLLQIPLILLVSPTIVRGDGIGYYAYLRSLAFDRDLDFTNEYAHFAGLMAGDDSTPLTERYLRGPRTAVGRAPNPWPMGPAILWFPFFLGGHVVAAAVGAPLDGYSLPYQASVAIGSAVYGFLGVLLVFGLCRRYFETAPAFMAAVLVWLATPLTAYMYFMPSMSHSGAFFVAALFVWLWLRYRGAGATRSGCFLLGLCLGMAALQRYQDLSFGVLVLIDAVVNWRRDGLAYLRERAPAMLLFGLGALLPLTLQMLAWNAIFGSPLVDPQAVVGHGFRWLEPQLLATLFAPGYGLLSWTPAVLVGVAGLFRLWRVDRMLGLGLSSALVVQVYTVASYDYFHQGASFGGRMLISCGVAFGLGIAAVVALVKGRAGLVAVWALGLALVVWNYVLLAAYGLNLYGRGSRTWGDVLAGVGELPRRLGEMLF